MNNFEVKCDEKTYQDPRYWDKLQFSTPFAQNQSWIGC